MQVLMTRAEAKALGLKRYFTGTPCKHGHVAERSVSNYTCLACVRDNGAVLRALDPGKRNQATREWRARNLERSRELCRKSNTKIYWQDPEKYRQKTKIFNLKNPEKARIWRKVAKAARRCTEGSHTAADIADILRLQRKRCAEPSCRKSLAAGYHVDHIMPLARGGSNDRRNLQALCPTCNLSKSAKDPIDFARSLGRLL